MEPQSSVVYYILTGQCAVLLWVVSVLLRNGTQIAVLQKTVDELTNDVRVFMKTEVDSVKAMAESIKELIKAPK